MRNFSIIVLFFSFTVFTFGQAGKGVFQFLDLPTSSRLAALGGNNVSLRDDDLNFAFQNPALLTSTTHNIVSLNYASYLADIMFGSAMYGYNYGENYFSAGIHYVDYGTFDATDEVGNIYGTFTAKDFALNLVYARSLNDYFTFGATFKPIYSVYEHYSSFALAADLGVHFTDSTKRFSAGLVFRNMGAQLKGFYDNIDGQHREPMPFDMVLGGSVKFKHAPIRISLTLNNLHRWNVDYKKTNQPNNTFGKYADPTKDEIGFVDMAFRHAVFSAEILPSKNMYLAISYNHRRRMEMAMENFKSVSGFSFGAGIKVYKFHVGFGASQFQLGHMAYQFSISTTLNEFGL